ncbi:MAG: hypothetical protein E7198_03920 [Schwartzia succinivorans]|uniref:hypothetical protein n=1 Tax=Schwartzia succinivorans TaxID=55507 RepID=UPI0023573F71|nr:hypothetical protein [Schwartzia succinivorans]MBE6096929.1 hypothetical protein [Schwartzia succinivorans]
MKNKRNEKKLTRLILTALILGGGTLFSSSAAEAAEVVINDGTHSVVTGNEDTGSSSGNHLTINSGATVENMVAGGNTGSGDASSNTVTINGGTLTTAQICGGRAIIGSASSNIVTINAGVTVKGISVGWSNDSSSGNTLNLGATGIKVGNVGIDYTQTIAITSAVGFDTSKTVLEMTSSEATGKLHAYNLDFTNATGLTNTGKTGYATTVGTMTLVKDPYHMIEMPGWVYGSASGFISDNTPFATNTGQIYTGGNSAKLIYTNTHTVNFTDNTARNQINYTIANSVTGVNLASWDSSKAAFAVPTGWTKSSSAISVTGNFTTPSLAAGTSKDIVTAGANFFSNVSIDNAIKYQDVGDFTNDTANGVTLSGDIYRGVKVTDNGTNANAKLTYVADTKRPTSIVLGDMTWDTGRAMSTGYDFSGVTTINTTGLNFSNPTAVTGNMTLLSNATGLTAGSNTSHSQTFETTAANGATLNATLNGSVTRTANTLGYIATGTTLNSINLNGWIGTAGTLPTGWTKPTTGGVTVDTGNFTVTPDTNIDIFSTSTANFFGTVMGDRAYSDTGEAFSNKDKGVALSGYKAGGVKVTNNGNIANAKLTYIAEAFDVKNIAFDSMAWGTPRDAGSSYNFENLQSIDATNLSFTNPLAVGNISTSTALLTNAGGLTAGKTVIGASHTQNFTNAAADNGVKLNGTINGTVSTAAGEVDYTLTGKSITSANLANWDSTKSAVSLAGWSNGFTAGSINAAGFTAPDVKAGQSKDILTAGSNFFSDGQITGSQKYDESVKTTTSDSDAGVTFTGEQSKGVKASTDGTKLQYAAGNMAVSDITLGNMEVGAGGTVTKRTADANYTFNGSTTINATNLTFDKPADVADSTLVSNATNITSSNPVTGANHSQAINNAAVGTGGITVSGTLNGTVAAVDGGVDYTVNNKTVSSMDLSGWDTTTEGTTLPDADWTGSNVAVTANSFAAAAPTENKTIFTTTQENFFGDVTGDLAYKSGEAFSESGTDGITLSGTISGGVRAENEGRDLKYIAELKTVNNIALGKMDWNTGRAVTGNYDFSGVLDNGVDATNLSFNMTADTAKSITDTDSWDLITGAAGLAGGRTVKGSPVSQTIGYGIDDVGTLSGTLNGAVTTEADTVKYTVNEKVLKSVDISDWNGVSGTASVDDGHWTKADGISVTGTNFTQPAAKAKLDYTILRSGTAGFFSGANIDDSIIFKNAASYSETDKGFTFTGTQGRGVTLSDNEDEIVYRVGAANISSIVLGSAAYEKDGTYLDKSSDFYDYSGLSTLNTTGFAMSMTDDQKKSAAVGDTMTLVEGNGTMGDVAAKSAGAGNYSYDATAGIAVGGTVYGSVSASGNSVIYEVSDKKATTLDITKVKWGETYDRSASEIDYKNAVVDSSNIFFEGPTSLGKDETMTLISNYGSGINKTRSGIFTLSNGLKGKGYAYYDSASNSLRYKVTLGSGETQETVNAVSNKAILIDPSGQEHPGTVTGGEGKGDGESTGNEAEVKGKVVTNEDGTGGDVNGGTSEEGDSKKNKADVEDSTIEGDVNGGKSENGNSTDNEAEVDNSNVGGDVNGGNTDGDGETKNNKAKVRKSSKVGGSVNGGHSGGNGDCTGNEAEVEGSEVGGDVNGGQSDGDGNTRENKTNVKDSKVTGSVNGGHSGGNGDCTGNAAEVEGSEVGGGVNGGRSEKGDADKNESTVSGGSKVTGDVTGGSSGGGGTANENKTTVTNSNVGGNVTGGESETGNTNKNETTVSGGSTVNGDVTGGKNNGDGTSEENKTNVDGSTIGGNVTGGHSKNGPATKNKTTVTNSNVGGNVTGGESENGNADSNEVSVSGGSIGGSVYGGKTEGTSAEANENKVELDNGVTVNGSVYGGYSPNGDASGNTVNVGTGKINGDIYGGFGSGATENNTINLYGGADVSNSSIIGGSNGTTGNTLNLGTSSETWGSSGGQKVKNISGFSTLNFNNTSWTSGSALTITDGTSSDLSATTINASNVNFTGIKTLSSGSKMTLLDQSAVTPETNRATQVNANSNFTIGTAVEGTGKVTIDENGNVIYSVESSGVSRQTHNTVMAAEAAMLAIDVGNDYIGSAQNEMFRSENKGADGEYSFAKMGGSSLEQKTGSHVNVHMWNGVIAVGRKAEKENAVIEYGAFVEHGKGSFTTFNDDSQRGDGDVEYTGGGVLARLTKNDGVYYEGSIRAGSIREETTNLLRAGDDAYGYKGRANYMGFHLGVGKHIAVNNGNDVEVYGKYFFNHKNGMSYEAGGDYDIDAVNSHVLRVGARYTMKREKWNFYGDLSYEHEFDGKAEGRANGLAIRGADTSGGSARLELGATFKESADSPWSLSLDMTGYAGNKKGIKGGISMNFAF